MYFPYLRGKQNEFIAVRELQEKGLLLNNTVPIFEPVKNNFKYFDEFIKKDIEFGIVINPKVGDFANNNLEIEKYIEMQDKSKFYICILIEEGNQYEVLHHIEKYGNYKKIYIHNKKNTYLNNIHGIFKDGKFNLMSSLISKNSSLENKVLFEDSFKNEKRNSDYKEKSLFNNYYQNYKTNGYVGISDYLIIGNDYTAEGGPAHAVAIHLSIVENDGKIYIKHFLSDSNEDAKDPGKKFFEALSKLITYVTQYSLISNGINEFINWNNDKHYPGLGSVKKASMKNHIELISKLI